MRAHYTFGVAKVITKSWAHNDGVGVKEALLQTKQKAKFKNNRQSSIKRFGLKGVGPQTTKCLNQLEIFSIQDLLFHFPLRYQDRTKIQLIRQLIPGQSSVIEGTIHEITMPSRGRTKLLCQLKDESGSIHLRFFHILNFQKHVLRTGVRLRCYSEVRIGPHRSLEMIHPEFQVIDSPHQENLAEQELTAIYPTTHGLSQQLLRKLCQQALAWMEEQCLYRELIPKELMPETFPNLKTALKFIHRPPAGTSLENLAEQKTAAQRRLIFEELVAHRISLLHMKQAFHKHSSVALLNHPNYYHDFLSQLPFSPTQAQIRVAQEVRNDLMRSHPMFRLVQGDVGSGKTLVAALAMLQAVQNGFQAALMAPTELLAEQHYQLLTKWFEPLGVISGLISGGMKKRQREITLSAIESGKVQIIVGTHALFQDNVHFCKLALVIVDEQHRFGVHQRQLLSQKGMQNDFHPHQMILTATPIPRTLAMSFYADIDCSIIDEIPPGRTAIHTSVIDNTRRNEVIERIRNACCEGRQAYWVCPLIEESEVISCQAANKTYEQLQKVLSGIKVGLIHGRMSANEKNVQMLAFKQGVVKILVATTVIEVGVDVPNASLMVIENSERLGLSQLHQLRGRVGRGSVSSHCLLLYQTPLSSLAKERLGIMRETADGFKIAQKDLELRGPGEVFGTRQTGELSFYLADPVRDHEMLSRVHQTADIIMQEHNDIIELLMKRWLGNGMLYHQF